MNPVPLISIHKMIEAIESFPSMPYAVVEIVRSIDDESMTPQLLSRKIESDLGLSAGVIRLANSSRYGITGGVETIQQAVTILGFNAVRHLACLEGISNHLRNHADGNGFELENFMRHSIGVGCCAKLIARMSGQNPDTGFVAGLLHDVGQIVEAATLPEEFRAMLAYKKQHDCHISFAERRTLNMDHAELGGHLARYWNFPAVICEGISGHHRVFDEVPSAMADVIHVAEVVAHALDLNGFDLVPPLSHSAMTRLDLSFRKIRAHFHEIEDEYGDMAGMLGVG